MLSGSTDPAAIADIADAFPNCEVRFLPSLHAKVYVADNSVAVITSSNLTTNGLFRNFECGVRITGVDHVSNIKDQVTRYARLGSPVSQEQLRQFAEICSELRELRRRAEQSVRREVRAEFNRRLEDADTEILRARVAGRAQHAVFAETILYLLRAGSRRTEELHREIQRIHPDLCDDTVDRVIDGQHFGKKWKHAVRTAQQYLKRDGRVRYAGTHWALADGTSRPTNEMGAT